MPFSVSDSCRSTRGHKAAMRATLCSGTRKAPIPAPSCSRAWPAPTALPHLVGGRHAGDLMLWNQKGADSGSFLFAGMARSHSMARSFNECYV